MNAALTRLLNPFQLPSLDDPDIWPLESLGLPQAPGMDRPAFLSTTVAPSAGSLVSAGAAMGLLADVAAQTYGLTGKGITIGIMSNSFNLTGGYAADVQRGDLSAGVKILKEGPTGGHDEGAAMAELVHKIAPGAQIVFYSAFNGVADFANGIKALASAGANIIVDDVTYLNESFYQQGGAIAQAVQQVVNAGVSYFTSASNEGSNFFETKFTGMKTALAGVSGSYVAENFGTATAPSTTQSLTIAKGATATIDLQWDQPFASIGSGHSSANSLGMVLYDSSNHVVAYALKNDVGGDPVQILQFTNTTGGTGFRLAIFENAGSALPGEFKYVVYGQGTVINDSRAGKGSGTIIGHEEVAAANTVGAVAYSSTARFGGANTVESFSSAGPGQFLFDANGNRLATPVAPGGVDFLATDGAQTSVFNPFYGTSAAAPDAAAVAALMLQANKTLAPSQVTSILDASAIKATGPTGTTGAGLIQATTAVKLAQTTKGTLTTATVSAGAATGAAGAAVTHAADDMAGVVSNLADDPTAMGDFTASLDFASGLILPDALSVPGAGMDALAMLNSSAMLLPFDTSRAMQLG